MTLTIAGACHCKNLSFELRTETPAADIRARACDCGFCRMHGARTWSDPKGSAQIRVADRRHLQKYRFGLETADFYVCRICGAYLAAVVSCSTGIWSTVNLRLTPLTVAEVPANYGGERSDDRIERRKRAWTPTRIKF